MEQLAHDGGVDDNFSSFNFIDKGDYPQFELPDFVNPLDIQQSDLDALRESWQEIKENPVGEYIVVALAVFAFILILKMLA